jgi:hypothetical protein
MKTSTALGIAALIIIGAGYLTTRDSSDTPSGKVEVVEQNPSNKNEVKNVVTEMATNSVMKDDVQYVTITARGGYSPRQSTAKAGIPTKLVVKTNGTYDCSASLVIRSLNYRKMLPNTGETIIDAGTPKVGDVLQGVCGMGMYSFVVTYK